MLDAQRRHSKQYGNATISREGVTMSAEEFCKFMDRVQRGQFKVVVDLKHLKNDLIKDMTDIEIPVDQVEFRRDKEGKPTIYLMGVGHEAERV